MITFTVVIYSYGYKHLCMQYGSSTMKPYEAEIIQSNFVSALNHFALGKFQVNREPLNMYTPFARLFPSARLMDWNMLVKHFRGWLHAIHGASGRIVFTHYYCNQSNRFGIVYIQTVRLPTYYHHQAHWNLERAVQIRRHQETMLDFELSLSHPSSSVCISRGLAKALVGLFFPIGWQLARANNYWMEHACWLAMPPIAYHNDSRRIQLNNKLDRIFTFFRDLKSEQAGCRVHGMLHWLLW